MKKIVGICGKMRHGKDTAASALVSRGYIQMAFADPIREALLKMDPIVVASQTPSGITDDKSYPVTWCNRLSKLVAAVGWDEAKKSPDVRAHLQIFGTEVGREMFGQNCWVDYAERKIDALPDDSKVVITDVRFENEAHLIKRLGGLLLWVHRPELESDADVNRHVSERMTVARMADAKIENTGAIEDLHSKVLEACGYVTPVAEEV